MNGESAKRLRRRRVVKWLGSALALGPSLARAQAAARGSAAHGPSEDVPSARPAQVVPGYRLRFPADGGSHPAFRTEWWYLTGWLEAAGAAAVGFQLTFFRTRLDIDTRNPSAFSPQQIVIGHVALSDAKRGHLLHDQKVARVALGLAGADEGRTHVWIDDWSLTQEANGYRARIPAHGFACDLRFTPTQAPLLQGEAGFSRKGPRPESASYYYSIPHLQVSGALAEGARRAPVTGTAWLDHEWSSSYLDERAVGWDWIGINLNDGSALMAFRMRDRDAGQFWAGGAHRTRAGVLRTFRPDEIEFVPGRSWRSPRTGTRYPVVWRVRAGTLDLTIAPLMDDQEYDTRASVGTIYWEGAVRALHEGKPAGRGYLELTGYWRPMKL